MNKKLIVFCMILLFSACSKQADDKPGTKGEIKNPYLDKNVISPTEALNGLLKEMDRLGLKSQGFGDYRKLRLADIILAENYHPSAEFRNQEPYFYIIPALDKEGKAFGAARVTAMVNHPSSGQLAEIVSYPYSDFSFLNEKEAREAVAVLNPGQKEDELLSKAVFVYYQEKWNLIADWGWAVKAEKKNGETEVFWVDPRSKQSPVSRSSSGKIGIYWMNFDVFDDVKRSSLDYAGFTLQKIQ